jgi:hypothetical protein
VVGAAGRSGAGCGRALVPNRQTLLPSIANTGTLRRVAATNSTSACAPGWSGKSESCKEGPKASKADHQQFLVLLSAGALFHKAKGPAPFHSIESVDNLISIEDRDEPVHSLRGVSWA